ncbi:S6 family peptidase [Pantoea sp. BAV 3049]|uniref:S6 family peptidase n=1 Tax=Pantoea sp. BAV 3049 TaxID=2654188 RepID=UPI00131D2F4F|nr:S6 family peptidase [Pantoea sp. BAV 3049]
MLNPDVSVQDYRDFAENLGKYTAGATNVPVYKTDGSLSGYLEFAMPDFGSVVSMGYSTLVSPSYIVSVKHNGGYQNVSFGNGAQYAATYNLINRNEYSSADFHAPRLNKVVTDAAPAAFVEKSDYLSDYKSRYAWYTRMGAGTQAQINEEGTELIQLAGAYSWKTGGTISKQSVDSLSYSSYLRYYQLPPDDPNTTLLSIGGHAGDSGSPVFAYDSIEKQWKVVGVLVGSDSNKGIYQDRNVIGYLPDGYLASIQENNTSADVTDSNDGGTIHWGDSITQSGNAWSWQGLADDYKNQAPSQATNEELDATKDLRFSGDGGVIELADSVNMGAGKLQFSADYSLTSASGANATWAGGGVEVDAGKEVLWQVNGVADDALHKIGDGTLHINATGVNEGSLNTGAGTVILDQQADADGQKQAFSSVTLVSGRPTVVLADVDQVSTSNIFFGYRGGTLDLNGNALDFKKINHTDSGAILANHNNSTSATVTLSGFSSSDITIEKFNGSNPRGTVGSIYIYPNPYTKDTEYFQLNKSSYWYYPTDKSSTATWTYLGTDLNAAIDYRLAQLNQQVFRGFIGETDEDKINGHLEVNVDQPGAQAKMALTGGMNLNGDLNVKQGTVLLSGQPVAHAAGVVVDDDWSTSYFKASQIVVNKDATFQVGEYADVTADIVAGESSRVIFGYNNSTAEEDKIWRCYSVINTDTTSCSQPVRTDAELALLPASAVTGDVSLADNASLYLGKVDYQGNITSTGSTSVTLDPSAYWTMTGNSNITTLNAISGSQLSMLSGEIWSAKNLEVDTLNATGLTLSLAVKPATAESDKLTIKNAATGDSNILDVSLLIDSSQPVSLLEDVVMVDAPAGTAHDYFTLPDIARGFSLYTPDYRVKDTDNRVQWLLQHNAEPEPEPAPDVPDVTPQQPDAEPESPSGDKTQPGVNAEDPASAKEGASEADQQSAFNPDDWFTIQDNKILIRETRGLMASRQYIFSEALSQLNSRASMLRSQPEKSGQWATIEQSKGGFEGFTVNQQTLNVGVDSVRDQQMFGFNASYTQGKTKGNGQQTHRLATVGVDYSWSSPAGWFVDAASRYMHLSQEFSFDPILGINGAQRDSNILAGSVKTGYQFSMAEGDFSVSPYIGLRGGYMSGYKVKGEDAQIALSSGSPYFVTSGVELKKRGIWASNPDVMLTAGLEYQYSPGQAGSRLTLSDSQAHREFSAFSDNRYRAQLGIEGNISKSLSLSAKVKTSFGGTFQTDYSGIAGITYHF